MMNVLLWICLKEGRPSPFTALTVILMALGGLGEDCLPPPPLPGGFFNTSRAQPYYPKGTILKFTCNVGYTMSGFHPYIRCIGEDRRGWQMPQFACNPVACGNPGDVAHAERSGHLWTYRSKVKYDCDEGYTMVSGNEVRYCQGNTLWSGELPSCSIINCSKPESPQNGRVHYTSLSYGSTIAYECFHRMAVDGDATRICQGNEQWSGEMPRCVAVDCGEPWQKFSSGRVKLMGGTKLDDELIYKCNNGVTEYASCLASGKWFPEPPECMDEFGRTEATSTVRAPPTTVTTTTETTTPAAKRSKMSSFFCKYRATKWLCLLG